MRKLLLVMLVVSLGVVLAVSFVGFGDQGKIQIGVLGKSQCSYWDVVRMGMEAAAAKYPNVVATFYAPTTEDINKQIDTVEGWIAAGYKGIALAPSDPNAMKPVIKEALSKGIAVSTEDTDAPGTGRLFYLGTSNYTAGYRAGMIMKKLLNGKGKVAILTGSLTALNSLQRIKGFEDAIAGTDIQVIKPILNDKEDITQAMDLTETAVTNNPDMNGMFAVYAVSSDGAAKALKAVGATDRVKLVSFDYTDAHLQQLNEGLTDAIIAQRQYFMGYESVVLLELINRIGWENVKIFLPKASNGDYIIDTGVDTITKTGEYADYSLKGYVDMLNKLGIPHKFQLP